MIHFEEYLYHFLRFGNDINGVNSYNSTSKQHKSNLNVYCD